MIIARILKDCQRITKNLTQEIKVLETAFNSIVSRSLNLKESSFGYKIADTFSSGGTRSLSPFDGFGVYVSESGKGYPVYWESKCGGKDQVS